MQHYQCKFQNNCIHKLFSQCSQSRAALLIWDKNVAITVLQIIFRNLLSIGACALQNRTNFILILFRQACVNFFVECLHVIIDINIKDVKSIFAFICSFTSFYLFCTKNVKC